MDFESLHSANFKLLDDTVSDWTSMVQRLGQLEKEARDGLRGKALKANWMGYNATVSRAFVGRTAGEFADAHAQATSIRNIMRDTRDELKTQQRLLKEAVERGRGKQLTVKSDGCFFTVLAGPDAKSPAAQKDVDALRDELQRIVDKAGEIDASATTALKALVDLTDYGFSGAKYRDRDTATAALERADRLAALAGKDPKGLTVKEFDELNAGLKKYSGDELFAEHFAEKLGAQGTLRFWEGLNDPHTNGDLEGARRDRFEDLQKHLSLTLATATQADTLEMTKWRGEMIDIGSQPVHKNSGNLGFQVMSNLMRWGNFEDQFLKDYGKALIDTEKRVTDNGRGMAHAWMQQPMDPLLNRTGTDSGADPVVGFMKALSNNPGAATDFFNGTFVTKDEDHEFKTKLPNGEEEKAEVSNFRYLFEEREWPPVEDDKGEKSIAGRNYMAAALEAATTGHPAGESPTRETPPHNEGQTAVMEQLVESIGRKPEILKEHGYMSDSIGQITSEYLPDIHRAMTNAGPLNTSVPKLFPIAGAHADFNHTDVTRLLLMVSQNPEGYAAVEVGQKAYMANLLDYHMNPDLPQDQRYPHSMEETVTEIARQSAEVGGTLAMGRQEGVLGEAKQNDGDYANAVNERKATVSGVLGMGVGIGTGFIASPPVGAAVGGAVSTVGGVIIELVFQNAAGEELKSRGYNAARLWEDSEEKNVALSGEAARQAAAAHKSPYADQAEEWARKGTADGFNDAHTGAKQMAGDLLTAPSAT
ncbi:DUF6571 family protein [Streptomyces coeruleoprunus]|uniref:DUF6571 family protein n=1 Tax=Streptomyces coeruleoprunus TaxID=285563 RepID=A0ABV9XGM3_9ACTN